ncbi:WYL domain-containing protein [Nakamurella sp. YIM 132087]|uniref:WYL domain-containing protein n=1 Tax=Nakamurella alba TaxID=2665158 RepID=A0A7K1FPZ5_9ACTN|nr:WYL domain-containing protein [Nakamurella alba]MTD14884.1 WYL domain-containing protein [Nakamurella alba]
MAASGDSPTARALRTLDVLHTRPGITAGQLGEALGVSDRAARRYIAILREAGIPVQTEHGPYGGYRIGRGLRLPPLVFTASEALGLVMAVLDGQHAAADPTDPVGSALTTLMRALPEAVGRPAAMMRAHALATPRPPGSRPDPETTTALVAAIASGHRVRITYRSGAGSAFETDVDPWAVVVRFGTWYLLCHSHHADAVRTYRIDRIRSPRRLESTFRPPDALDPVALLERHLGMGWDHATEVVFDAPYEQVRPHVGPRMGTLEPLEEDRCRLVGTTTNTAMYAGEYLAAIPIPFHVLGGPELRAAVAEVAARMSAAVAPVGPVQ